MLSPVNNTTKRIFKVSIGALNNLRSFATHPCAPFNQPICSKESLEKQKPCTSKIRRLEEERELPKTESMWETVECCPEPCPGYIVRFDELYYASSDKKKRKYQQTWTECPNLKIKEMQLCHHEDINVAPMEKRIIKRKPLCACPIPNGVPRICIGALLQPCPKLVTPNCVGGLRPPDCHIMHQKIDCKKVCAPYPSYSECKRDAPDRQHPKECKCLDHQMMCDAWIERRRRMTVKSDEQVNKLFGLASNDITLV